MIKKEPTFNALIDKTRELNAKFPHQMNKQDRIIDLMEEVGELAQAMLIVDKRKKTNNPGKQKTKADIADALCDVLYDLVMLSQSYEINLPNEYEAMLHRLKTRVDEGEFSA